MGSTILRLRLLKEIERFSFISTILGYYYLELYNNLNSKFNILNIASEYKKGKRTLLEVVTDIYNRTQEIINHSEFQKDVLKEFKDGYYKWAAIRYFLYEYEENLREKSKNRTRKIDWIEYINAKDDFVTVEHIYPKNSRKSCWQENFGRFSTVQKNKLKNSLGNLLALSKPKNSSLQDNCFLYKRDRKDSYIGYRYGSYSEIEVSSKDEWTSTEILERGMKLLEFMEERWALKTFSKEFKIKLLNLEFL